jgi:hypothetical protein
MKKIYSDRHILKYDYFVQETGEVYSSISNRWLKPWLDKDGYCRITLMDVNGIRKALPLHRIVLMTYNPVDNMSELQVNHKDGNKLNNTLDNLEWVNCQENIAHAVATSLRNNKGQKNYFHKLTEKEVLQIIDLLQETNYFYYEIAAFYNVQEETIARIKRKKSWTYLTTDINFKKRSTTSRKA